MGKIHVKGETQIVRIITLKLQAEFNLFNVRKPRKQCRSFLVLYVFFGKLHQIIGIIINGSNFCATLDQTLVKTFRLNYLV